MAHEKCYAICESKCRVETMSKEQIELPTGTILTIMGELSEAKFNEQMGYGTWRLLGDKTITFDNGSTMLTTVFVRAS